MPNMKLYDSIDFWNSEEVRELRRTFLAGKVPDSCRDCVKANLVMDNQPKPVGELVMSDYVPLKFEYLSMARSNTCNNACQMCSAELSTTYGRVNGGYVKLENNFDLSPYYHEMKEVYISGGNPVQDPGILKLLKELPPTVEFVMLTSNGSKFPKEYLDALARFRFVNIAFSIDADKEVNEIVRQFAIQERTYETIRYVLANKAPHIRVSIQPTITAITAGRQWRLYDELRKQLPVEELVMCENICHYPKEYSILNMPEEMGDIIDEQIRHFSGEKNNYAATAGALLNRLKILHNLIYKKVRYVSQ